MREFREFCGDFEKKAQEAELEKEAVQFPLGAAASAAAKLGKKKGITPPPMRAAPPRTKPSTAPVGPDELARRFGSRRSPAEGRRLNVLRAKYKRQDARGPLHGVAVRAKRLGRRLGQKWKSLESDIIQR